uniref:hypothetical protein n=1 Tax=Cephaleuros parasiticus TaxID=173370 RepID=UPI001EDEB044|nr:hypothetical protein MFQ79_pgp092 [Cephaleuros parasiticus]UIB38970.1 hypothetical protein [Cephaleuros parasiticus]
MKHISITYKICKNLSSPPPVFPSISMGVDLRIEKQFEDRRPLKLMEKPIRKVFLGYAGGQAPPKKKFARELADIFIKIINSKFEASIEFWGLLNSIIKNCLFETRMSNCPGSN